MNIPDEAPKLNPWPFLAADAVLIATAYLIGSQAHSPFSTSVVVTIGCLIFLGAILAVIPFLLNFTRRQETGLLERQREIASLAQTTAASAEQLSIAAASLHGIAESATRTAKLAETLPQKLQEKIHEFKEQLNEVSVSENEVLSQEVNTLRAAETERIESLVTTVRKLSGEFARLEAATRQNVNELTDALKRFTTSAEQAAVEATTSIASQRAGSEKSLASAHTSAMRAIEETLSHAIAEIDTKLGTLSGQLTAKIEQASEMLDGKIARLEKVNVGSHAPAAAEPGPQAFEPIEVVQTVAPASQPAARATPAPAAESVESTSLQDPGVTTATVENEAKPARKRVPKKATSENDLTLGLDLPSASSDDFSQLAPDDGATSAVSADGLTRLLVTAYIGIGNKLFVRGEGPGLSWEHGTPLQFVSIGKWRWETPDAIQAIRAKLFKNDEIECAELGEVTIEPGHQREVTAKF